MKKIALTQRVVENQLYPERRDAIDQRWYQLFTRIGFLPLLIPNDLKNCRKIIQEIKPDGIILSGGNDLPQFGGQIPERDEVENYLIALALKKKVPLLGICHGMQIVMNYFNIPLQKIKNHASTQHKILLGRKHFEVNSYHQIGVKEKDFLKTNSPLKIVAQAEDGTIEQIRHFSAPIHGIMWHPERNSPFEKTDIDFLKKIF